MLFLKALKDCVIFLVNGTTVSLDELADRKFDRPVIIRSFPDTSWILMHRVIDRIEAEDVEFEDGKFKGYRPDFRSKGSSNKVSHVTSQ